MTGGAAAATTGPLLLRNRHPITAWMTTEGNLGEGETGKAEARSECSLICNPLTLDTVGLDLEEFDWRWKD